MNTNETPTDCAGFPIDRVMSWLEVQRTVGLSRPQIWRLRRDGEFPAALKLSEHRVGWLESEIQAWLRSRPRC